MPLTTKIINELLKIDDSYKAPAALMDILLNHDKKEQLFKSFLDYETDLTYEWFQSYFEDEHSERKNKKQDFTPQSVSKLLSQIAGSSNSYFEATAGTGGIAIQFWNNNPNAFYYLEELSDRAIPFLLFNLSIRNVEGIVVQGDSLTKEITAIYKMEKSDKYSSIVSVDCEEPHKGSTILMNPPYSAGWSMDKKFLSDDRFKDFGKLAPKSKADFAFLLHGFHHLVEDGTMAVVLPHGVLFRGAAEGTIRQKLLDQGNIDAVIGLPEKLFRNTGIPTTILVLKKNRESRDVLFIDASKEFEKGKQQNLLSDSHIKRIVETYKKREDVEKYAHLAQYGEIKENDYNLNIPRFVDTFEEEPEIDLIALSREILEIDKQIEANSRELFNMFSELTGDQEVIEASKDIFRPKGQTNLF